MSFILDALKKSETDRQEQGPTEFANIPTGGESPGVPRWLWILGLLLAVNLVVLVGLLFRNDTPDVVPPSTEPPASQATDPAPAQATARDTASSFTSQLEQARERQPIPASQPESRPESRPEPAPEPAPAPAEPEVSPAVQAARPEITLRALPTVEELRANGTISIAELHLDIHVYSEAPADRFAFINMTRHREGSKLAEGPVVSEITPEGVVLDYSGTVFLLPRE